MDLVGGSTIGRLMGSRGETCYIWRTIIPALDSEDTVTPDDLPRQHELSMTVLINGVTVSTNSISLAMLCHLTRAGNE
jgi:hypothetical protein